MRYGDNKPKYIRWAIYGALIGLSVILQNSGGGLLTFFGAQAFIVVPVCICISMVEDELHGSLFGVLGGVLLDISGGKDCFNSVVMMLICAVCGLLISRLMRNNVLTALVLCSGGVAVYELLYYVIQVLPYSNPLLSLLTFYLPSLVITVIFVPLCYKLVTFIYSSHKNAEESEI